MIGAKELFQELREGDEYVTAQMRAETYWAIPSEQRAEMTATIRQYSCEYDKDEIHCALVKEIAKKKKQLRDREFELNHFNRGIDHGATAHKI